MRKIIIIVALIWNVLHSFGQQIPDPPAIKFVTVEPTTGLVYIKWINSGSPHLKKYYIVQMADNGNNNPYYGYSSPYADSVNYSPTTTSTSFMYDSVKYKAVWFNMIALDSLGIKSGFSISNRTVFLTNTYDSCNSSINLTWSKYVGWGNNLSKYIVWEIIDNFNPVVINDSIPANSNQFSIYASGNQLHTYYVLAKNTDGTTTSTSYESNRFVKPTGLPSYIQGISSNFTSANQVTLNFSIDPNSQISNYQLLRSTNPAGSFLPVKTLTNVNNSGNINTSDSTTLTMYYELEPITACNQVAVIPNLVTAMYPAWQPNIKSYEYCLACVYKLVYGS